MNLPFAPYFKGLINKLAPPRYRRAVLIFAAFFVIFMLFIDLMVLYHQNELLMSGLKRQTRYESDYLSGLVKEKMTAGDLEGLQSRMKDWIDGHSDIVGVTVTGADDALMAEHGTVARGKNIFIRESRVKQNGRPLGAVRLYYDYSELTSVMNKTSIQLFATTFVLSVMLVLALWYVLRRMALLPLEHEIEARENAELKMKSTLDEKSVLLKEVHHRVKNNMQIIASLLRLQARSLPETELLDTLRESENRIESMSMIHEALYMSENMSKIDFGYYVDKITNNLFRTYGVHPEKIRLNKEIHNLALGIDVAVPCGLIINELISNSLKYAFPDDRSGEILISLNEKDTGSNGNSYELRVSDDGAGMPEGVDIDDTETLGLQLVSTLAGQMHGKMRVNSTNGTSFIIDFEDREKRRR